MDKFYTKTKTALTCINMVDIKNFKNIIEPSAGDGAFSSQLECEAFDILPEHDDIIQQDFYTYNHIKDGKTLVIGNPPYGKWSNGAIKFFNKAAEFADTIAFILPVSFKKITIQNRLNLNFHLIKEIELLDEFFITENTEKIVPSVFQIWHKTDIKREKIKTPKPIGYEFVKDTDNYDYIIKRVGYNSGEINTNLNINKSSNFFIKTDIENFDKLVNNIKYTKYNKINSINKFELITNINQKLLEFNELNMKSL